MNNILFQVLFNMHLSNGDINHVAAGVYSVLFIVTIAALYERMINNNNNNNNNNNY